MRTTILVAFLLVASPAMAFDEARLLQVIAQIECPGGWDGRQGPAGEASAWQITPAVWRENMGDQPFADAWNVVDARECASRHLRRLARGIRRHGYEPTPARLALAWNVGLAGAIRRELRLTDYAHRTLNLYAAR